MHMRTVFPAVLIFALWSPAVSAQNTYAQPPAASMPDLETGPNHPPVSPKTRALLKLRDEEMKLKTDDGGNLTPEHRAYLQQKLNAIQAGKF
jgi:hypothetical protein